MAAAILIKLGCLSAVFGLVIAQDSLGPYECIKMKRLERCPGTEGLPINVGYHLQRMAKGLSIEGEMLMPFDFDEKISIFAVLNKWTNNGWQFYAKVNASNACQTVKTAAPKVFKNFAEVQNAPSDCPWPPGAYQLKNFTSCLKFTRFPMLPYGHLRVELNLTRLGEVVGCMIAEGIVEPTFRRLQIVG